MIFVTDSNGHWIHTSREWTDLTGQSSIHALGKGWLERIYPDDRDIVETTIDEALRTVAEFSVRYRLLMFDGTLRWIGAGGVPSFGISDGAFIGYLGSLTELAEGAGDTIRAYGNVGKFVPPPTHVSTASDCKIDRIADCLILAHSLIESDGVKAALPGLRAALFEVGRVLAARTKERHSLN